MEKLKTDNHLYLEMSCAHGPRLVYIAVRYTKENRLIRKAAPQNLPKAMSYIGRLGIECEADRPGFFDEDQLYDPSKDPKKMKNTLYKKSPDQSY